MSERVRCNSCHGEYSPIGRDGMQYFHACPPLSRFELEAAIAARVITLTPTELEEVLIGVRRIPRPNQRDENLVSTRQRDAGKAKSDGDGTTVIAVTVDPKEAP